MSAAAVAQPDVHMNGNGAANGNGYAPDTLKEPKFASGLILPPPEIKCACIQLYFRRVSSIEDTISLSSSRD